MRTSGVMILDYGVGNLHSLAKAVVAAGGEPEITADPMRALQGSCLILPGVGAFEPAAQVLAGHQVAIGGCIRDGYPTLGICLGMQLLFDGSEEGAGAGLGVLPGAVTRLAAATLPQIGWNSIDEASDPLVAASGLRDAYYANSFACRPHDVRTVTAWSTHDGDRFPAIVREGSIVGVQFHPEKSSAPGLAFLRAFLQEIHS